RWGHHDVDAFECALKRSNNECSRTERIPEELVVRSGGQHVRSENDSAFAFLTKTCSTRGRHDRFGRRRATIGKNFQPEAYRIKLGEITRCLRREDEIVG